MTRPRDKIATCCYCGHRAALVLGGRERHELSCGACGAPLRDLKAFPAARTARVRAKGNKGALPPVPEDVLRSPLKPPHKPHKARRGKRRKSLGRKLMSEVLDLIEDVFD